MESNNRFCQNCGAKTDGMSQYCIQCGTPLFTVQGENPETPAFQGGAYSSDEEPCAESVPNSVVQAWGEDMPDRSMPDPSSFYEMQADREQGEQSAMSDTADAMAALSKLGEDMAELKGMFSDRIARTDYETATMKKLSDEVQDYREDLYRKLTLPFMKDLIEIRNALMSTAEGAKAKGEETVPLSVIEMFGNMVRDSLESHGVRTIEPAKGEKLDAACHKTIGRVPTADVDLQGTVVSCSSDCYMLGEDCLSPALVTVYCRENRA